MRELISNAREIVREYYRHHSIKDDVIDVLLAFWVTAGALAWAMYYVVDFSIMLNAGGKNG